MKNFKNMWKQLVKDESGQGSAEYILLIALVVAVVFLFGPRIKTMIMDKVGAVGSEFSKDPSAGP
jgi:Flp pilus assembly pilin Flp